MFDADYDPDTWSGLFEDVVVLTIAVVGSALVVAGLWQLIGWIFALALQRG